MGVWDPVNCHRPRATSPYQGLIGLVGHRDICASQSGHPVAMGNSTSGPACLPACRVQHNMYGNAAARHTPRLFSGSKRACQLSHTEITAQCIATEYSGVGKRSPTNQPTNPTQQTEHCSLFNSASQGRVRVAFRGIFGKRPVRK